MRFKQVLNGPDFTSKPKITCNKNINLRHNNMFDNLSLHKYSNVIPIVLSDSFECLYISMGIYSLTGTTQALIIGKSIFEFIHPDNNISSLFSDDTSTFYKSTKTLQFNEVQNPYINHCTCKREQFLNQEKNQSPIDQFKNLNRKSIGIRFKSTITYQGESLVKQGSHCYIDMNLVCNIRQIDYSHIPNDNSNKSLDSRFLVGVLIPFHMPKVLKSPRITFSFTTYHKLCLQADYVSKYFFD